MTALSNHLQALLQALRRSPPRRTAEPPPAAGPAAPALFRWWHELWGDPRSRYLAEATDLADLERRIRVFDQSPRDVGRLW